MTDRKNIFVAVAEKDDQGEIRPLLISSDSDAVRAVAQYLADHSVTRDVAFPRRAAFPHAGGVA